MTTKSTNNILLSLIAYGVFSVGEGNAQQVEETRLEGFVFETAIQCAGSGASDCSMVSFQIYGEAAVMIFQGMKSEISKEPDICTDMHYKSDTEGGLICYISTNKPDSLCTFGYDFSAQQIRGWAGSC